MKDVADLLGRLFIGFIFLYEALDSIMHFQHNKDTMITYGITWRPGFILALTIGALLIGSLLVLIGYNTKIGATLLMLYWIPFTFIVYDFWNDPLEIKRVNGLYFMRNMAIVGGLFLLLAHDSGRFSIKRLIHRMRLPS